MNWAELKPGDKVRHMASGACRVVVKVETDAGLSIVTWRDENRFAPTLSAVWQSAPMPGGVRIDREAFIVSRDGLCLLCPECAS